MTKSRISQIVENMAPSGIRAFFDIVLNMKEVISLGVGEPDFVTPWLIREKAIDSLEQGYTSYTSNKGMPELRKQIARFLLHKYGLKYDPDEEILITVGVSEGVDLAFRAILNAGDSVLVPQPAYVSYGPVVELAGCKPVFIPTTKEEKFKLTEKHLQKAMKRDVRAMMLNYPANPTGASYTRKELLSLTRFMKQKNLLVVSDEVYDDLTYDFNHTPLAALPGMKDRVIYLNGFSKTFAMTGFRLGWACGPKDLIAAMTKIHQYTLLCASINSQMAAIEALRHGAKAVQDMKREYARRRNYIVGALNDIGLNCHMPEGAFYVFPSIESTGMDSLQFAQDLLKEHRVALVPGSAFGDSCDQFVRISYASSFDNLKEAIKRMDIFLKSRKKSRLTS